MIKKLITLSVLPLVFLVAGCGDDEIKTTTTPTTEQCMAAKSVSGQVIEDQYIVAVAPPSTSGRFDLSIESVLSGNGISDGSVLKSFEGERQYHVVKMKSADAEKLKADARVTSVEPDRKIAICGCFSVVEPRSITWSVDKVGYSDGTGKTAWVIDTGVDTDHPDLNVDKTRSKSFLDKAFFDDDNGHGTHVAGIIGALNNGIGILGVASGANIAALKVLDENGDGKLSALLNALTYVKSYGKSGDVVNISIGFPDASAILENEIKSIAARGIYFSLAAGNESVEANTYSPARTAGKNIYTVSAVDSLNNFASFSNYGNDVVDFAAPGIRILSTYKNGKYAILSGTSMAAPHVAGILLINNGVVHSSGIAVNDPDGVADEIAHQ